MSDVAIEDRGGLVRVPLVDRVVPVGRIQVAALLIVLNIADVILTKAILARGGIEGNPVMKALMAGFAAPLGLKIAVAALAGTLLLFCPTVTRLADRAAAAVVGVYIAIVTWNLVLLGYLALVPGAGI